jgi:hypothetical protein
MNTPTAGSGCIRPHPPPPPPAGSLDDLHSFDLVTMTWTDISAAFGSVEAPSARQEHGFTSAEGKLFVHGGYRWESNGIAY